MSINRRDFCIKAGVIALLAGTQPWKAWKLLGVTNAEDAVRRLAEWDLSAHAELPTFTTNRKVIWNARLNTGTQPDTYTLYGWMKMPQWNANYDPMHAATWPDHTQEPSSAWHDNFAANVAARTDMPHNFMHFAHEMWPRSTHAERLATATKIANFCNNFRSRMPGWKIGFFGEVPLSTPAVFSNYMSGEGSSAYTNNIKTPNNEMAEAWAAVDAVCPHFY